MSVPLLGFIASACGVSTRGPRAQGPAADRHAGDGRHDPRGHAAAVGRARPGDRRRPGRARRARPVGRVPHLVGPRAQAAAAAGRELGRRPRTARSGASRSARASRSTTATPLDAEDVAATFNRLADPDAGSNALSVFSGVLSKGSAKAVDDSDRRVPARRAERQLPVPRQLGQLQRDHPPRVLRGRLGEDVHRDRPVEARGVPAGPGRQLRPQPGLLGQGADHRRRQVRGPLLHQRAVARVRAAGQRGRRPRAVLGRGRQGAAHRPGHPHDRAGGLGAPPGPPAQRRRSRSRTSACARRWRCSSTASALVDGLLDTKSDLGNDSPFAPVFPSTAEASRSASRTCARPRSCWPPPGMEDGFTVQLSTLERVRDARPRAAASSRTCARPASRSTSASPTPPPTTATRRSATRAGSTRRWGSRSTATAACPTCCSARRCCPRARGTARTSRTRSTTRSSGTTRRRSTSTSSGATRSRSRSCCSTRAPILFTYFYYYLTGAKSDVADVDVTAMGHYDLSRTGRVA